jgi:acetyltransferase-like isoleucine patch superfamily enzyme
MKNWLKPFYRRWFPGWLRDRIRPRYDWARTRLGRLRWPGGQSRLTPHSDFDFCPWLFWSQATPGEQRRQQRYQADLARRKAVTIGRRCFVSTLAGVAPDHLSLGDDSYIGAYAYITGDVTTGGNCTINPFATLRGRVALGQAVRIGAHASLLGFNHISDDPETPIFLQSQTTRGITVGDDVWIGASVIITDGVRIGNHCVIGAGAVVTRAIPDYSLAVGNPARVIRDRRTSPSAPAALSRRLAEFGRRAAAEWPAVLSRCLEMDDDGPRFVNSPGAPPTARAWCDAVEIAGYFGGVPAPFLREALIERLRAFQDPGTGLAPDPGAAPLARADPWEPANQAAQYNVLAVGYALEVLGASFRYPVAAAEGLGPRELRAALKRLPWAAQAWRAGSWIDSYATALYFNLKYFGSRRGPELLLDWLREHQDPSSGLWGRPTPGERWLQPVNGFYRTVRGTYAQFGAPAPMPEKVIDSVLAHTQDRRFFNDAEGNACNVLDVIHPLWWCGQQVAYRRFEIEGWARRELNAALTRWQAGQGFAFEIHPAAAPSLKGTEMWLAIIYLLAEVCGESQSLGYRPKGIHRLEPGWPLAALNASSATGHTQASRAP